MICGYVRVSTVDQHTDRQDVVMTEYKADKVFSEKISGKSKDRPRLKEMIDYVREGDTVVVADFSRLARNTLDLLDIVKTLENKGVTLVSAKESIDTSTATGKLLLTVIGAISTFERDCLLERQREGIAIAKAKGVYKGRQPVKVDDFEEKYKQYLNREIKSKSDLAAALGVSRQTVYKLIEEYNKGQSF